MHKQAQMSRDEYEWVGEWVQAGTQMHDGHEQVEGGGGQTKVDGRGLYAQPQWEQHQHQWQQWVGVAVAGGTLRTNEGQCEWVWTSRPRAQ